MKKKLLTISIALFILTLTTNQMLAQNWNFQPIVPDADVRSTDIKLDNNSCPHVLFECFVDGYFNHNYYYYATWNEIGWIVESVPGNNEADHAQFCLDQNNDPHIIHKYNNSSTEVLYYTYRDTTSFLITQSIENVNYNIISVYFRNGILEFIASSGNSITQFIYNNQSNSFTANTIGPSTLPCGYDYKSVVDDDFNVYFAYVYSGDIRFGFFDGETVSSFHVAENGQLPSITLDNEGIPHISYYNDVTDDLIHARLPAQAVKYLKSLKNKTKQIVNNVAE